MVRNFLLTTLRSFWRYKNFTFINLAGLALGLSCSIFILLWVTDELNYDAFHQNGERIFRVMENQHYAEGVLGTTPATPGLLAEKLKTDVPEIILASSATWEIDELVTVGKESHKEGGRYVEPDFLNIFTFPLLKGDPRTALSKPGSIVISEKIALRYFGNIDPLGKLVAINNDEEYEVTGVMKDVPRNSSLQFEFLLPYEQWLMRNEWAKSWENTGPRTFILLQQGASRIETGAKIRTLVSQNLPKSASVDVDLIMQPYPEMYLFSNFKNGKNDGGRIEYIRSFSIVAVVVLLIACINFMNLTTARSLKRAKEIGIRKVNGASRKLLMGQFLSEAIILSIIGLGAALLLVELFIPIFRQITGKEVFLNYSDPALITSLLGISLFTGIISGSYPAFFLSSFQVVSVLKGMSRVSSGSVSFRKGLVVFQFCLTIVLIFCSIVVYRQVEYIKNKNLGFDKENLIITNLEGELKKNTETLTRETSRLNGIISATVSTSSPLVGGNSTIAVEWPGKQPEEKILFTQMAVGYDYLNTMKVELIEGRDFSHEFASDSAAYLVNEEAAKRMRLTNPVGQKITFWNRPGTIVGLLKDYHLNSLHNPIEPVILHLHPEWANVMITRIEPGRTPEALKGLGELTARLNPAYPFEYHFVDETFEQQYKSEMIVGVLAYYFSSLAIFISCLGLLGLIMFTAEQRTKEIGVRKVLGASVSSILVLLSRDFMILVFIAFLLSTPVAWYVMNSWLHHFAYRIEVGWEVALLSGAASLVIAFCTVSLQGLRAASINPTESLKNE